MTTFTMKIEDFGMMDAWGTMFPLLGLSPKDTTLDQPWAIPDIVGGWLKDGV